jgi:hypothetical protein
MNTDIFAGLDHDLSTETIHEHEAVDREASASKMMRSQMKTLAIIISTFVLALSSIDARAAEIPEQIRGSWCRIDNAANVLIFRRTTSCSDIRHVYTAQGRSSSFGKTSETCKAESVEPSDRIGWDIVLICGNLRIEQFLYPMSKGRLGLMTTGLSEIQ